MNTPKFGYGFWFFIVVVLAVGFLIWTSDMFNNAKESKIETMSSREVALLCTTDMATEYHIHPEITILILGVEEQIPDNLGIKSNCMTSIHRHTDKNIIHVESSIQKDFTLGDFFAVWKKDFSKNKILDNEVSSDASITVTVNGNVVDTYENTVMKDKDSILIEYKSK